MPKPRMAGRPARYRGKVQRPITIKLTPEGHARLAEGMRADGLSRSDYFEQLLRRARPRTQQQGAAQ